METDCKAHQAYPSEENVSIKSKLAAMLLCVFLGPLGAHRFYADKTNSAITLLVLSLVTIGVVGVIWTFVDLILIAAGKFLDGEGKPILKWVTNY